MDILESYLRAVKRCLPRAQSDDIIKELSDDLRSQIEEQEAALGRPFSDEEMMAFFKQHGDPMTVARRYRQDHHSLSLGWELIGPELFPFYLMLLGFQFDAHDSGGCRGLAADSRANHGGRFHRSGFGADYLPHGGLHDSESYPAQVSATLVLPACGTCSHAARQSLVFARRSDHVGCGGRLVARGAALSAVDFGIGGWPFESLLQPGIRFYVPMLLLVLASIRSEF